MRALVVYYSLTGKTELVAKAIAQSLNADIRRIEETRKRRKPFVYISGTFDAMRGKVAEMKCMNFSLDNYDLVFLGTPAWLGKPTPAMNTFISKADFQGKEVIIFVTMGGVGHKSAIRALVSAIESKGGKIIGSFSIRTRGVKDEKITERGRGIGRQFES